MHRMLYGYYGGCVNRVNKTTLMMNGCKYCNNNQEREFFECYTCCQRVHPRCLKDPGQVPGGLLGDVFFSFFCRDCSGDGSEKFERDRMAWLDVVLLALYNLSITSIDSSHNGFFHCNKHIIKFIDSHWKWLFPYVKTKRKSYKQMITSTLKSYSPEYFTVGDDSCNFPSGSCALWYKLSRPDILPVDSMLARKDKRKKPRRPETENFLYYNEESMWCDTSSRDADPSVSSSSFHHMFCSDTSASEENMYSRSYVKPSASLSEYLFAEEDVSDIDVDIDVTASQSESSVVDIRCKDVHLDFSHIRASEQQESTSKIKREFVQEKQTDHRPLPTTVRRDDKSSLFARNDKHEFKPWIKKRSAIVGCFPLNENEENYLLASLGKRIIQTQQVSIADIRLHRKLQVRKYKRERNLPVFDPNNKLRTNDLKQEKQIRILDRYHHQTVFGSCREQEFASFRTRLMGHTDERLDSFVSPFTGRRLKPFIRRDYESLPLWPKLLQELISKFDDGNNERTSRKRRAPIDYSYVRPQHIPAVNSLASQYFWPGINLSECLQYPDFSCVVLYKKLIVAFAFMVPDVGYNEAYISFIFTRPEWRGAGIGTFMLYHLIQTCIARDITLHVSATNSALFLYQRFGFKVEEFVQDFYEKYLPVDSNECRHALFLRLNR